MHPDLERLRRRAWIARTADNLLEDAHRLAVRLTVFFTILLTGWFFVCTMLAPMQFGPKLSSAISGTLDMFLFRSAKAIELDKDRTKRQLAKPIRPLYQSPYK